MVENKWKNTLHFVKNLLKMSLFNNFLWIIFHQNNEKPINSEFLVWFKVVFTNCKIACGAILNLSYDSCMQISNFSPYNFVSRPRKTGFVFCRHLAPPIIVSMFTCGLLC